MFVFVASQRGSFAIALALNVATVYIAALAIVRIFGRNSN